MAQSARMPICQQVVSHPFSPASRAAAMITEQIVREEKPGTPIGLWEFWVTLWRNRGEEVGSLYEWLTPVAYEEHHQLTALPLPSCQGRSKAAPAWSEPPDRQTLQLPYSLRTSQAHRRLKPPRTGAFETPTSRSGLRTPPPQTIHCFGGAGKKKSAREVASAP